MYRKSLVTALCGFTLLVPAAVFGQVTQEEALAVPWLSFADQTATRLVILSTTNDPDDTEKDIAVGDFNRDGWDDVVVARKGFDYAPGETDLLLLNLDGVLTDTTATDAPEFLVAPPSLGALTNARDVAVADFNLDGWPDLIFGLTGFQGARLFINQKNDSAGNWKGLLDKTPANLDAPAGIPAFCSVAAGDVSKDGKPDVYLGNYFGDGDRLFLKSGFGNAFTDATANVAGNASVFNSGSEIADLNHDGLNDILKIDTSGGEPATGGVRILYNAGNAQFPTSIPMPTKEGGYHFTTGDLNCDGLRDIYAVYNDQDVVALSKGLDAAGQVIYQEVNMTDADSARTAHPGGNIHMADLDQDGDLDIGISSINNSVFPGCDALPAQFVLLRNNGKGKLKDPFASNANVHTDLWDFAFLDINRDGCMDVFQGLCADGYAVFIQRCPRLTEADPTPAP